MRRTVRFFLRITLLASLAILAACESDLDRRYLDTSLGKPLELPPDLSEFETESSFDLPDTIKGAGNLDENGVPVLAKVDAVRLQGNAQRGRIEIDYYSAEELERLTSILLDGA